MDLRLYVYNGYGNLAKVGRNKSSLFKPDKHYFDNMTELMEHVKWLAGRNNYYKGKQFVVIEYDFEPMVDSRSINSRIIETFNIQ